MSDLATVLEGTAADVKASLQLIELVNEMIDKSKAKALDQVDTEFDSILAQLEDRERELVSSAKSISSAKLDRMITHAEKLKRNLSRLDTEAEDYREERATDVIHKKMSTQTAQVVRTDDPLFFPRDLKREEQKVMMHGEISSQKGVPLATMFEAATEHPGCERFFCATLKTVESMAADEGSGLVTADDVELLVVMLEEFSSAEVHTQACMAMCNVSSQNPKLAEEFGARGGIELLTGWLGAAETDPEVLTATCLLVGVLCQHGENKARFLGQDIGNLIAGVISKEGASLVLKENAYFALSSIAKDDAAGKAAVKVAIPLALEGLKAENENKKAANFVAKSTRFLYYAGLDCLENEDDMMKGGVADLICTAINTFTSNSTVVNSACSVVWMCLNCDESNKALVAVAAQRLKLFIEAGLFSCMLTCLPENKSNMAMNQTIIAVISLLATHGNKADVNTSGVCTRKNMKNVMAALTLHARSLELAISGSTAIQKFSVLDPMLYLPLMVKSNALTALLKGLSNFSHSAEYCALTCNSLEKMTANSADARTELGSEGGMLILLTTALKQPTDDVVIGACKAVQNMCNDHVPNKESCAGVGAVKTAVKLLEANADKPTRSKAIMQAIVVMCEGNSTNARKFQDAKGGAVAKDVGSNGGDADLVAHLTGLAKKSTGTIHTTALGQDVREYLEAGKTLPTTVDALSLVRQICKQEVIYFTAVGKDPSKIDKFRLVCLDKFDIVVYGGADARSDSQFTQVVKVYPLSKIKGVRVVPEYKKAFYVDMAGDEQGTFVCDNPEETKEWVAAIEAQIPGIQPCYVNQTVGEKQEKRFMTWCNDVMKIYKSDDLDSELLELHCGTEMTKTEGSAVGCNVWHGAKDVQETFEFPLTGASKAGAKIAQQELALSWESWIRQYIMDRDTKLAAEQEAEEARKRARMAKLENQQNGIVEEESDEDDEDEFDIPPGYSLDIAKELERMLTELTVKVHKEETIDEWILEEVDKEQTRINLATAALERVEVDIEHEKNRTTGDVPMEDPGSFSSRLGMFQNL